MLGQTPLRFPRGAATGLIVVLMASGVARRTDVAGY